jgi:hypothetical protein
MCRFSPRLGDRRLGGAEETHHVMLARRLEMFFRSFEAVFGLICASWLVLVGLRNVGGLPRHQANWGASSVETVISMCLPIAYHVALPFDRGTSSWVSAAGLVLGAALHAAAYAGLIVAALALWRRWRRAS